MAMDPAALLTAIESAITALVSGGASSYSIGSRTVSKLDLAQLMEERRILLTEVQRSTNSGVLFAKMGRPLP